MRKDNVEYFSASEEGSFARFTIEQRFPKIYEESCSDAYTKFKSLKLGDVFNVPNDNFDLNKLISSVNNKIGSDFSLDTTFNDFFYNAPFFEAEVLFYHALLVRNKYFQNKIDFFAAKKDNDYQNNHEDFRFDIQQLFSARNDYSRIENINGRLAKQKEDLHTLLIYSLSANRSDLSQLKRIEHERINILQDDSEVCCSYITAKTYNRFDIICDNCGSELFSDIYLAVFMLVHNYAKKVVLHVKSYPYFVSDATAEDVGKMLNILIANNRNKELLDLFVTKKIEVKENTFWTQPLLFDEMPKKLKAEFKSSDLVFVKGDLNYRRLVGDIKWDSSDSFKERCLLKKIPVIAPRVLKSDVLVGINAGLESYAKFCDTNFKTNGKWGVIHAAFPQKINSNKKINTEKKQEKSQFPFKKNKENKGNKKEKLYFSILLAVLILLIFTIIANFFTYLFYGNIFLTTESGTYSIVLTALAILVSGTFIMPKLILENEVEAEVKRYAEEEIQKKTSECIGSEISKVKNELNKTDAHLSRMISFFLTNDFSVWSIGWAFRSLKRYIKLDSKQIGLNEYYDFINFINTGIIEKSKCSLSANKDNLGEIWNKCKNEADNAKDINYRPTLRAVKDIVDFIYDVEVFSKSGFSDDQYEQLHLVSLNAGELATILCKVLFYFYEEEAKKKEIIKKTEMSTEWLLSEILKISNFGNKCENETVKKDFKQKLKQDMELLVSENRNTTILADTKTFFFKNPKEPNIKGDKKHETKKTDFASHNFAVCSKCRYSTRTKRKTNGNCFAFWYGKRRTKCNRNIIRSIYQRACRYRKSKSHRPF